MWDEAMDHIDVKEWASKGYLPPYNRTDLHAGVNPADRPSNETYNRFVIMVACGFKNSWNQAEIAKNCPYRVADPVIRSGIAGMRLLLTLLLVV